MLQTIETFETMDLEMQIEAGKTTPNISFRNGELNIIGRSISHNIELQYEPLLKFFYLYSLTPKQKTVINIFLDYMNSDTNRSLMTVMIIAEKIKRNGFEVEVNWQVHRSDDPMIDQGRIFESLVKLPFQYIIV